MTNKLLKPTSRTQVLRKLMMAFALLLLCFVQQGKAQIYLHDFGTTAISTHPYTVAPGTFNANLSSSSWSNSTGAWTSFAGSTGAPNQAIALNNSGGTPTITLTFTVNSGFQCTISSYNFWRQRSASGAQNYSMTINGIAVGSGTVPTTGAAIGTTSVTNPVNNQTGTITVVLSLSGATSTGTFRLDDFTLTGTVTSTGGVNNPTAFTATANSATQINLAATANGNGNNIVVVYNNSGTFSAPTNGSAAPAAGNAYLGGTVFYNGAAGSMPNHTSLTGNTQYFYKAFSYDGSNNFSPGLTANATTYKAEPSQHASSFTCGTTTQVSIPLTWTDAAGSVAPDGYLIKWGSTSFAAVANPVDGTAEADGATTLNVLPGTQSANITGLSGTTTYYFKIYSYTNSTTHIDYKTDGSISQTSCTTQAGPILAWQFGVPASSGDEVTYTATTINSNLNTSALSRGSGIAPIGLGRGFSANSWRDVTPTKANAITDNEYFQFTVKSNSGYNVSLSALEARMRRSGATAPNAYIWQYSTDGTTFTDIGSDVSFTSTADGVDQPTINLTGISALQNVPSTTTLTFRLYAWGGTSATATFAIGRFAAAATTNSLAISGTVVCVNPVLTSVSSNNDPVCVGTPLNLTAAATGVGTLSYQWSGTGTISPNNSTGAASTSVTGAATGTYTVTVTNACGSTTGSVSVTVNPNPTLSFSSVVNESCPGAADGSFQATAANGAAPYDYSHDNFVTQNQTGIFNGLSPATYTVVVLDQNGCSASATQAIASPNSAPAITCGGPLNVNAGAGLCTATVTNGDLLAHVSSVTGTPTPTVTFSPAAGSFPVGTTSVTATATNSCGMATCTFNVVVADNQNPVITCPATANITTDAGLCTSSASIGTATATDNCLVSSVVASPAGPYSVGPHTITWTATDNHGNTATCTQTVNVTDNQNPVITCPATANINTDAGLCTSSASIGTATATDNCSVASVVASPAGPYSVGPHTITWTATDVNGNTATCTQTVNVTDNQNPVITCPATANINTDAGLCTSSASIGTATATDNCSVASVVASPAGPYSVGPHTITWTATDVNGNTATCTQTVNVTDNQNPVITCPSNITTCNPVVTFSVGATDNCSVSSVVSTPASGSTFAVGTTTVNSVATDVNGNTSTCSFTVTVSPAATAGTVSGNSPICAGYTEPYIATGGDAGGSWSTGSSLVATVDAFGVVTAVGAGTTSVTYTVNVGCGAPVSSSQNVTVTAAPACQNGGTVNSSCGCNCPPGFTGFLCEIAACTPPVFTVCATNQSANTAGLCSAVVNYTTTVTGTTPTVTYTFSGATTASVSGDGSGSAFNVGVTTVTVNATNGCGSDVCTFTVTVTDNENPVITCPATANLTADAGLCTSSGSIGTATATDNCLVSSVVASPAGPYAVGTHTITWTATDNHGNTATCSQTVNVTDTENPVITCPATANITADAGLCTSSASIGTATATDNCAGATVSHTPAGPYPVGTTTVTWTATDASGNTATCTQSVIVTDTQNPVITCPATANLTADAGLCTSSGSIGTATATDNCAGATVSHTPAGPYSVGTTTVTWTATDASGNTATCTQSVVVTDTQNPVITCPATANLTADASLCTSSGSIGTATATDNCAGATVSHSPAGPYPVGTTTVTWTATDASGNTATCTQSVVVTDTQNPVITCPANIAVCDPGSPVVNFSVTATDNCSIASVVSTPASGSTFPPGTTTVNSVATDVNGNTSTCSFTVTVSTPSTAPTSISTNADNNNICLGNSVVLTVNGGSLGTGAVYNWYTGSCGGTLAGTGSSITKSPTATTTYYVRAEGACNTTTCASVTVVVSTSPVTSLALMPFTGMPSNVCAGTVATLSIAPVSRATYYVWDVPTGSYFNGNPLNVSPFTTTTPSVTVTFGSPSGSLYNIGVQAGNACGTSVRQSQKVRGLTSVPASVSGPTTACANSTVTYSTAAVTGATSYLWTVTGNATVSGTGTTATVSFGAGYTGGTVCVAAQTTCYTSPTKCITISTSASTLNAISGTFTACPNSTLTYSVPASTGAASYTWTSPTGSTITTGQGTNNVSVNFGPGYSAVGNICVSVTSTCGVTSAVKCKTVAPGLPSQPNSIAGPTNGLCGQSVVYACPSQGAGVTYTWTVPSGASIISGQGTTSVNVSYGTFITGSVCVTANNTCGSSTARCITVKGAPATPGAITANPSSWCANTSGVEFNVNVSGLSGTYTLNWTYPTAPVATYALGGGNSTSLLMDWISGTGNINVVAYNACGSGTKTSTWSSTCRESGLATASTLTVSPNPTTGMLNINYTTTKGNTVINVQDLTGRVVLTKATSSVDGTNNTQLDMSKLAKGAYMLNVQSTQGNKQIKVVVE